MSYKTLSITSKEFDFYYSPKVNVYNYMLDSVNSIGYGQAIYNFVTSYDNSINSVNIWDNTTQSMIVLDPNNGTIYSEASVGPDLWGVTSQEGIAFLNGDYNIPGLAKLKYCNSCPDGNGLKIPTITTFKNKFTYLGTLIGDYGVTKGYIFFDWAQPLNQNFFPSVFDSRIGNYIFKNYQGTDKTELEVSVNTGIPREEITLSIDDSQPIKPVGCQTVGLAYSISASDVCTRRAGSYDYDSLNQVLYNYGFCGRQTANVGYYYDGENIFYFDGATYEKYGPCPGGSNSVVQGCCDGTTYIIPGIYSIGFVFYTKGLDPATCFEVVGTTSNEPDAPFSDINSFEGISCAKCTSIYSGGCKK